MTLCKRKNLGTAAPPTSPPHPTPTCLPACLPLRPASLGDEQLLRVRSGSVNNAAGVAPGGVFCAAPTHYESVSRCQGTNLRLGVLPSAVQLRQAERSGGVGDGRGRRGRRRRGRGRGHVPAALTPSVWPLWLHIQNPTHFLDLVHLKKVQWEKTSLDFGFLYSEKLNKPRNTRNTLIRVLTCRIIISLSCFSSVGFSYTRPFKSLSHRLISALKSIQNTAVK